MHAAHFTLLALIAHSPEQEEEWEIIDIMHHSLDWIVPP